jgi:hypothetical protein
LIVAHPLLYKALAFANITSQAMPMLACILVHRPRLRALCGLAFVAEVFALGHVMGLWNPYWLLMAIVFIDWDRLWLWTRRQWASVAPRLAPASAGSETPSPLPIMILYSLILAGLLGWNTYVSLCHSVQRRYTFPFTAYPMYSLIMANKPFSKHQPYQVFGSIWRIESKPEMPADYVERRLFRNYYNQPWATKDVKALALQAKLMIETDCKVTVTSMEIEKTIFAIPPPPAVEIEPMASGLIYRFKGGAQQTIDTVLGYDPATQLTSVKLIPRGFAEPSFRVGSMKQFRGPAHELTGEFHGDTFCFSRPAGEKMYLVIWVRDPTLGAEEFLFGGPLLW